MKNKSKASNMKQWKPNTQEMKQPSNDPYKSNTQIECKLRAMFFQTINDG